MAFKSKKSAEMDENDLFYLIMIIFKSKINPKSH